jgi:hypothetical protein
MPPADGFVSGQVCHSADPPPDSEMMRRQREVETMVPLLEAATNLTVARVLGGLIGFERQWRQRLAGLRTNTLVALGSAMFVVFAGLFPGEASPAWPVMSSPGSRNEALAE